MEKINSKAAILRIPDGTELTLVNSLMGPCNKPRKVQGRQSNALKMLLPDGRISWLYLDGKLQVIPTDSGFEIYEVGSVEEGKNILCAAYKFGVV